MKKWISVMLLLVLMLGCTSAVAAKKQAVIPDFCKSILDRWGATNGKELAQAVLDHWYQTQPIAAPRFHYSITTMPRFRLGGTTKELIRSKKDWDVAIVSSKDVDLQALADAEIIYCNKNNDFHPDIDHAYSQWLYPAAVQEKLPQHPLFYYHVFCYSYNEQTDEAVFFIFNTHDKAFRTRDYTQQIFDGRAADEARAVEGICRTYDWQSRGMPELMRTEDWLAEHPTEWDWAILRIDPEDKLEKLSAAGLLYDFSQDPYWTERAPKWEVYWNQFHDERRNRVTPVSVYNAKGQLVAIPYIVDMGDIYVDKITVFVVNAKSPYLDRALAFSKHFIKSKEYHVYGRYDYQIDAKKAKKYLPGWHEGWYCPIFKEDVDW